MKRKSLGSKATVGRGTPGVDETCEQMEIRMSWVVGMGYKRVSGVVMMI